MFNFRENRAKKKWNLAYWIKQAQELEGQSDRIRVVIIGQIVRLVCSRLEKYSIEMLVRALVKEVGYKAAVTILSNLIEGIVHEDAGGFSRDVADEIARQQKREEAKEE